MGGHTSRGLAALCNVMVSIRTGLGTVLSSAFDEFRPPTSELEGREAEGVLVVLTYV